MTRTERLCVQAKGQEQGVWEGSHSQFFEEDQLFLLVSFISSPDNSNHNSGYQRGIIYRPSYPLKGYKPNPDSRSLKIYL